MKRKALLIVADCSVKAFEGWASRGHLPFAKEGKNWSDYSLDNAIELKLMVDAAKGTDVESAGVLASQALHKLHPIHPLYYTDNQELWVALVRYDWPDAPEDFDARTVVAGRWEEIEEKAQMFVRDISPDAAVVSIYAVSATRSATKAWEEAHELGLPEGDASYLSIPEDLAHFPEWFRACEMKRREVVFGTKGEG